MMKFTFETRVNNTVQKENFEFESIKAAESAALKMIKEETEMLEVIITDLDQPKYNIKIDRYDY